VSIKEFNKQVPVYILVRTSGRPEFFKSMLESVKSQDYKNIFLIVHYDNHEDESYLEDKRIDLRIYGKPEPERGDGFYNLYCNSLLDAIPVEKNGDGYFYFLDDDDILYSDNVISEFVKNAKRDHINVARVERWNGTIWPRRWKVQTSFQTECFLIHTDYRNMGRWWARKQGDHDYSRQITRELYINWIEDLYLAKAQEGKGHGLRLDRGEVPGNEKKKVTKTGSRK
jgi:hypothetical protein